MLLIFLDFFFYFSLIFLLKSSFLVLLVYKMKRGVDRGVNEERE